MTCAELVHIERMAFGYSGGTASKGAIDLMEDMPMLNREPTSLYGIIVAFAFNGS